MNASADCGLYFSENPQHDFRLEAGVCGFEDVLYSLAYDRDIKVHINPERKRLLRYLGFDVNKFCELKDAAVKVMPYSCNFLEDFEVEFVENRKVCIRLIASKYSKYITSHRALKYVSQSHFAFK